MSYGESLILFTTLLAGIILIPGMDMLFVLSNTLTGGRGAGMAATAGIMAGGAVHALFGVLGVGLLFALAPWLFIMLLLAGALYMAWIGITLLRSSIRVGEIGRAPLRSRAVAFRQGLVTCLINPKAYLFVVTVYPQFLKPAFGPLWPQAAVMGALTLLIQGAVYGGLALAASKSAAFLVESPRATVMAGRICGVLFMAIAAWTGWHGWLAV